MRIWGESAGRRWNAVAAFALVGWLAFDLTTRTVFGSVPWPESVVDYRIMYDFSCRVVETHQYPAGYPYPPPAVAVHALSAAFPYPTATALWMALTGVAAVAIYATFARMLGLLQRPGLLLVLPLAHSVAAHYFQWDMRSVNCNLIVLAAVVFGCAALARGWDRGAGFWFALAVALKLLPVLLLPYLAWTRRWRALTSAMICSFAFWGALPLVAFGANGFAKVYAGWSGELTRATDPALKHYHPILISLEKAALHATGHNPFAARAVALGVCALWVGVGLAGAVASRVRPPRDGFAILAYASLLVIGPAAVSPYLEPYHLVAIVVPAVLLLAAAMDSRQPLWVRVVAIGGFLVGLTIMRLGSSWALRGLFVNAQALVLCSTVVLVAWVRIAVPSENGPKSITIFRRLYTTRAIAKRQNAQLCPVPPK